MPPPPLSDRCRLLAQVLLLLPLLVAPPVAAFHPRLPQMPAMPAVPAVAARAAAASSRSRNLGTRLAHGIEGGPIVSLLKAPDDMYASAVKLGMHKAEEPAPIIFLLGIQAGLQVGIGAAMAVATMAGMPGIQASDPSLARLIYGFCGLPCGLLMTATTGTMLFTGNTALVSVALMEKKVGHKEKGEGRNIMCVCPMFSPPFSHHHDTTTPPPPAMTYIDQATSTSQDVDIQLYGQYARCSDAGGALHLCGCL